MAALAVAMFSTLSTAGATAAAGTAAAGAAASAASMIPVIGGAAASAGGLAAAGSGALSVLQGLVTAGSMVSTILGGVGAFANAQQSAEMAKLQGNAEFMQSEEAALRIRREMVQKIGNARVAFAGSGLDISSADAVTSDLTDQADFETAIEQNNGKMARLKAEARARAFRANGFLDLAGSALKAGGQGAQYALDIARRG